MNFLPLLLGVRRSSDAERGGSSGPSPAKLEIDKALQRDNYTCRFCGFRATQYQRVFAPPAPVSADHELVTACTFCEQCLMLERAGMMGSGYLLWLPEIGQAELNHLARAIYVGRASGDAETAQNAARAYDALMTRRADAKKRLGSDDPLVLATIMHESLDDASYKKAAAKLDGIRLMPLEKYIVRTKQGDTNQFAAMVKFWTSPQGPFAELPVGKWKELFQASRAKVGHA